MLLHRFELQSIKLGGHCFFLTNIRCRRCLLQEMAKEKKKGNCEC